MPVAVGRLKRRSDFLRLSRTRQRYAAPGLVLQVGRRPDHAGQEAEAAVRVGFTVSKKIGNAVARNRARRRLKAVAQAVLPGCARADRDYVLIGRKATLTRPYAELRADLETALKRAGACAGEGQ